MKREINGKVFSQTVRTVDGGLVHLALMGDGRQVVRVTTRGRWESLDDAEREMVFSEMVYNLYRLGERSNDG